MCQRSTHGRFVLTADSYPLQLGALLTRSAARNKTTGTGKALSWLQGADWCRSSCLQRKASVAWGPAHSGCGSSGTDPRAAHRGLRTAGSELPPARRGAGPALGAQRSPRHGGTTRGGRGGAARGAPGAVVAAGRQAARGAWPAARCGPRLGCPSARRGRAGAWVRGLCGRGRAGGGERSGTGRGGGAGLGSARRARACPCPVPSCWVSRAAPRSRAVHTSPSCGAGPRARGRAAAVLCAGGEAPCA